MGFRDLTDRLRRVRRLRLQYGLRSLLLTTLAVCLALGWYVERVRRQQLAVAALREAGADIDYSRSDDPFADDSFIEKPATCGEWVELHTPPRLRDALGIDFFRGVAGVHFHEGDDYAPVLGRLRELGGIRSLSIDRPVDDDLIHVGALHSLTAFSPTSPYITDAGLVHLTGLKRLEFLDLRNAEMITDAGVAHLADLRRLTSLSLHGTAISDAGITHLADKLDLEYLDLESTRITDKGLLELARLRHLKRLDLSGTAVGGAGLAVVNKMPELRFLDLQRTMITDDGLAPLRSLAALQELNLSLTAITDKSLDVLERLSSLKEVNIDNTAITPEGADMLRDRSPAFVTYVNHPDYLADELTQNRVRLLMRVGRWSDALSEIGKYQNPRFDYPNVLIPRAHCLLGLEQWGEAERTYREAFIEIAADPSQEHWIADGPWHELSAWPWLFARIAQTRPNDFWRWIASARRAVLAGQWSLAVRDYARATQCRHETDLKSGGRFNLLDCEFEYALSRLLARDTDGQQRVCTQIFGADQRAFEKEGETEWFRDNWKVATHLSFLAPQGAVGSSQIANWLDDEASSWWKICKLETLILCRAAMFSEAVKKKPPKGDEYGGRYWFARAMAQQHLGNCSQARQCLARGTRWLDRRMRADRVSGYYNDARLLLEAEVLRREAQRLIAE